MFESIRFFHFVALVAVASPLLVACGGKQLATCQFEEIEDAEVEFDPGDIDLERGEVEMICSQETIDVTWSQFRRRLNINPGDYKNRLSRFQREVDCVKEEDNKKQVLCKRKNQGSYESLNFSYDD
jgi:hypothetical protein